MAKSFIANPTTQNGIDYVRSLEKLLNTKKKDLLVRQQNEIIRVYQKAYLDIIDIGLKKAGGDPKKLDKLTKSYVMQIYDELEDLLTKYNKDISDEIYNLQRQIMYSYFDPSFQEFMSKVDKLVDVTNRKVVNQMIQGGIYHDGKGLSERIWDTAKTSGNKMSIAINSCIAQGMGAAEMSQNLKEFAMGGHHTWSRNKIKEKLGPGYARKYSGGLDYEALRLARTTLTHQAQIAVINSSKINPYLQFIKWHSEHQAGRTCQQCIDRDGQLFPIDEVPLDHPNGMCWIQPVYSIDGKTEATPEEIAKDMKAWAEGKKNSKLMSTIDEYKPYAGSKKPAPKPRASRAAKGVIFTDKQREKEYKKMEKMLEKNLAMDRESTYNPQAIITQLQQAPKAVQDMYLAVGQFNMVGQDRQGAYYAPNEKKIHLGLKDKYNNKIRFGEEHRFDVLFHEWGHLIDDQWKKDKGKWIFKRVTLEDNLTMKGTLAEALGRDAENWQKAWVEERWQGKKTWEEMKGKPVVTNKFSEFLNKNEKHTIAIQDGIRGITNGKIRTMWGHDIDYYKWYSKYGDITAQDSANIRVSSELWAEISAGMTQPETREFLEKNFPETVKEYNNLLQQLIDQYKKDKKK